MSRAADIHLAHRDGCPGCSRPRLCLRHRHLAQHRRPTLDDAELGGVAVVSCRRFTAQGETALFGAGGGYRTPGSGCHRPRRRRQRQRRVVHGGILMARKGELGQVLQLFGSDDLPRPPARAGRESALLFERLRRVTKKRRSARSSLPCRRYLEGGVHLDDLVRRSGTVAGRPWCPPLARRSPRHALSGSRVAMRSFSECSGILPESTHLRPAIAVDVIVKEPHIASPVEQCGESPRPYSCDVSPTNRKHVAEI